MNQFLGTSLKKKRIKTQKNMIISNKRGDTMKEEKKKDKLGGLFIPAGLFIGMGMGFLFNQLVAGMFLGLGLGFIGMILYIVMMKK